MDKNGNKIILGLDVSTTTIGVCLLLDDNSDYGKIIELTHISPQVPKRIETMESLFFKKNIFKDFIVKYKNFGIDYVVIEEPLLSSQNVNTVAMLLRFNSLISNVIYDELKIVPQFISSYDARRYCFPQLITPRKYAQNDTVYTTERIIKEIKQDKFVAFGSYSWAVDKKTILQDLVAEIFPDIQWLYDSKGELIKENFDSTDAYVACCGYIRKQRNGEIKLTHSNLEIKGDCAEYDVSYWNKTEHRITYLK